MISASSIWVVRAMISALWALFWRALLRKTDLMRVSPGVMRAFRNGLRPTLTLLAAFKARSPRPVRRVLAV